MRKLTRLVVSLGAAAVMVVGPALAETKPKPREDAGVQEAIAYQRAKDRADAAQARKEAQHPEQFTQAPAKRPSKLASEQKKEALEHGEKTADREAQPPKK